MDVLTSQVYWTIIGVIFVVALFLVGFITAACAWFTKRRNEFWDKRLK